MEFSNEYWKLVITPRYASKVDCVNCNGSGIVDNPDAMGLMDKNMKCFYCWGDGKRKVVPEIPISPEMCHKFWKIWKSGLKIIRGCSKSNDK